MHRFFISIDNVLRDNASGPVALITDLDDIKHAVKALRIDIGEMVELCDTSGIEHICEVSEIETDRILCRIQSSAENKRESGLDITLFQGLPKADKLEMIIQKTTELGVNEVVPVQMKRSVSKWKNDKSAHKKIERWNRIAFEASKQSKRGRIPVVAEPIDLKGVTAKMKEFDLVLVPYENESAGGLRALLSQHGEAKKIGIVIGPEGGFDQEEIAELTEAGAYSIKLGPRIMRTETAGVVTVALVQYELGDLCEAAR